MNAQGCSINKLKQTENLACIYCSEKNALCDGFVKSLKLLFVRIHHVYIYIYMCVCVCVYVCMYNHTFSHGSAN